MEKTPNTSLLLVEGKSEQTVIPRFCKECGIPQYFDIESGKSLEQLKTAMKLHLKSSNVYKKLWVIIDADTTPDGAWESMKYILEKSGKYDFDRKMLLPSDGVVIPPRDPADLTVGIWVMPDNNACGMFEDFLLALIPSEDTLLEESTRIVNRLHTERDRHNLLFKAVHKSKARIHTWLAWHDTPGESLAVAVTKHLFDTSHPLSLSFSAWLSRLNP